MLAASVLQLCEHLGETATVQATMQVLLKLADKRPDLVIDQFDRIKMAAKDSPSCVSLAAQILSTAGKLSKVHSIDIEQKSEFITQHC